MRLVWDSLEFAITMVGLYLLLIVLMILGMVLWVIALPFMAATCLVALCLGKEP